MNIFDTITAAIHKAAVSVGSLWTDHIEPGAAKVLSALWGAESKIIGAAAESFIASAVPAAITAIQTGNTSAYLDTEKQVAQQTLDQLVKQGEIIAIQTISPVVSTLLSTHQDVVAATASAASGTGAAPAASPAT